MPHQPPCPLPHEHLTLTRGLLQTSGRVHRVPDQLPAVPNHELARVDPGAHPQLDAPHSLQLFVEPDQLGPHCVRRPHGPHRVVLMQPAGPEARHHSVTDELLHPTVLTLDRDSHDLVEPRHYAPNRLGVQRLLHRRGPGQVREQDTDHLAHLGHRGIRR